MTVILKSINTLWLYVYFLKQSEIILSCKDCLIGVFCIYYQQPHSWIFLLSPFAFLCLIKLKYVLLESWIYTWSWDLQRSSEHIRYTFVDKYSWIELHQTQPWRIFKCGCLPFGSYLTGDLRYVYEVCVADATSDAMYSLAVGDLVCRVGLRGRSGTVYKNLIILIWFL